MEYHSSLNHQTAEVLTFLSEIPEIENFTLVGGSALSIHIHHRLSEDLDFFTWFGKLEDAGIDSLINKISNKSSVKTLNTYFEGKDILVNNVKVTLFANSWEKLRNRTLLDKNLFIGNLELITAMKVNTLSLRAKFRDYYDLFVIAKETFDIKKILDVSVKYIPGMTKKIFSMQLPYIEDIDDERIEHLNPKYKVTLEEMQRFFEREIKKLL